MFFFRFVEVSKISIVVCKIFQQYKQFRLQNNNNNMRLVYNFLFDISKQPYIETHTHFLFTSAEFLIIFTCFQSRFSNRSGKTTTTVKSVDAWEHCSAKISIHRQVQCHPLSYWFVASFHELNYKLLFIFKSVVRMIQIITTTTTHHQHLILWVSFTFIACLYNPAMTDI